MRSDILKALSKDLYDELPAYIDEYLAVNQNGKKDEKTVTDVADYLYHSMLKGNSDINLSIDQLDSLDDLNKYIEDPTTLPNVQKQKLNAEETQNIQALIRFRLVEIADGLVSERKQENGKKKRIQEIEKPREIDQIKKIHRNESIKKVAGIVGTIFLGVALAPLVGLAYALGSIINTYRTKSTIIGNLNMGAILVGSSLIATQTAGIGGLVGTMVLPGAGSVIGGMLGYFVGLGIASGVISFSINKISEGVSKLKQLFTGPKVSDIAKEIEDNVHILNKYRPEVMTKLTKAYEKFKHLLTEEDIRDIFYNLRQGKKVKIKHLSFFPEENLSQLQNINQTKRILSVVSKGDKQEQIEKTNNQVVPLIKEEQKKELLTEELQEKPSNQIPSSFRP